MDLQNCEKLCFSLTGKDGGVCANLGGRDITKSENSTSKGKAAQYSQDVVITSDPQVGRTHNKAVTQRWRVLQQNSGRGGERGCWFLQSEREFNENKLSLKLLHVSEPEPQLQFRRFTISEPEN
jgi:hypothetical protein